MTVVHIDKQYLKPSGNYRAGFYIDPNLKYYLDEYLIKGVKHNHDGIVLWTGLEGTGKSTHVQAAAYYCDQSLDINRIVFTGKDLMDAIDKAKPGQAIIFDEAIMDMAAQDFASEMQKILIRKFTLIRKKRLFIFIVIPSIFMLRRYFAIFRTRAMINCYCPDGITRGKFRFYSFKKKKELYLRGYKEMNMGVVKANFHGDFTNTYGYFIPADDYENKKDAAIKALTQDKGTKEEKMKLAFEDYKLKIKIQVEQFKGKWKDKFSELKAKNKENLKIVKEKYKHGLSDIKTQALDLEKGKDKKKIQEQEINYCKLLYFFYQWEKDRYEKQHIGEEYAESKFNLLLNNNKVHDISIHLIKTNIKKGKEIMELEI